MILKCRVSLRLHFPPFPTCASPFHFHSPTLSTHLTLPSVTMFYTGDTKPWSRRISRQLALSHACFSLFLSPFSPFPSVTSIDQTPCSSSDKMKNLANMRHLLPLVGKARKVRRLWISNESIPRLTIRIAQIRPASQSKQPLASVRGISMLTHVLGIRPQQRSVGQRQLLHQMASSSFHARGASWTYIQVSHHQPPG